MKEQNETPTPKKTRDSVIFSNNCRIVFLKNKGKMVLTIQDATCEDLEKAKKLGCSDIVTLNHKGSELFSYVVVKLKQKAVSFYGTKKRLLKHGTY